MLGWDVAGSPLINALFVGRIQEDPGIIVAMEKQILDTTQEKRAAKNGSIFSHQPGARST